jgi:hypothetical protein
MGPREYVTAWHLPPEAVFFSTPYKSIMKKY